MADEPYMSRRRASPIVWPVGDACREKYFWSGSQISTGGYLLPHEEFQVQTYHLLVVQSDPGTYRLYVGQDGKRYCHYDTGTFRNLKEAVDAARRGFDPAPFEFFPYAPFTRDRILAEAPHGFDFLKDHERHRRG